MSKLNIVDSSDTDLNSAWMGRGLRSVFDESAIAVLLFLANTVVLFEE